jgi:hypothetical protein
MIGIGGLARSGKDTLASNLVEIIKEDLGCDVRVVSIADALKAQMNQFLLEYYGIDSFTEDSEEKKIIRDLLVCHGETMKKKHGKNFWVFEALVRIMEIDEKFFPIIPDVRFDYEVEYLKDKQAQIIHITKLGNKPPNEIEAKNDPLVKNISDLTHTWPAYEPDQMHQCKGHAQILWQMLKETHGETWKKIYS